MLTTSPGDIAWLKKLAAFTSDVIVGGWAVVIVSVTGTTIAVPTKGIAAMLPL
jgi:hypothetical protein